MFLNVWRWKQKRPGCSKILKEQNETKGISPNFSKSMVKLIGVFQKFVKTKQNEVKLFKILQDRSKTNVFFSNRVEEEKRKNEASFLFGKKTKKNEYNRSSTIEDLPLLQMTSWRESSWQEVATLPAWRTSKMRPASRLWTSPGGAGGSRRKQSRRKQLSWKS